MVSNFTGNSTITDAKPCLDFFVGFDGVRYDNDKLNEYGTYECRAYRDKFFSKYSFLANALRAEYQHIAKTQSHVAANNNLRSWDDRLSARGFNATATSDELETLALACATECDRYRSSIDSSRDAYKRCQSYCASFKVSAPLVKEPRTYQSCVARMCCSKWWRRQLNKNQREYFENAMRDLRQVHKLSGLYCSSPSVKRHQQRKKTNRQFLESFLAINEDDQEYTLAELSDKCVSNPSIRRFEMLTRCRGFEEVADKFGYKGVFLTVTAPSRYHRMRKIINKKTGKFIKCEANPKYAGFTPRDTHDYLSNLWSCIQAKLCRDKIKPFGFRVVEPHHDGTPHWHFLLFVKPEDIDSLIDIFKRWSLKDSPDEKGAEQRVDARVIKSGINPKTNKPYSATGYIIKYVCKNIDGHGVDNTDQKNNQDWSDEDSKVVSERIEAWSRTYRIRQFQQIGGPSVTVYRELRRVSTQPGLLDKLRQAAASGDWDEFIGVLGHKHIYPYLEAAHNGDWSAYFEAMGGPESQRSEHAVKPMYDKPEQLDKDTGELTQVFKTTYGDDVSERVVGIMLFGIGVMSRLHYWRIESDDSAQIAQYKIMDGIVDICEGIRVDPYAHEVFYNLSSGACDLPLDHASNYINETRGGGR